MSWNADTIITLVSQDEAALESARLKIETGFNLPRLLQCNVMKKTLLRKRVPLQAQLLTLSR